MFELLVKFHNTITTPGKVSLVISNVQYNESKIRRVEVIHGNESIFTRSGFLDGFSG